MKNLNYLWLAGGLFLLGSCSSEAPDQVVNGPDEESGDAYFLRVDFENLSTRGASDDMKKDIENATFIFYDAKKNYISTRKIEKDVTDDTKDIFWVTSHDANSAKCAVIKLSRIPKYVKCVVNAETDITESTLNTRTVSSAGKANKCLYMSSSTYWDTDETNNPAVCWSEINSETMITDNKDNAKTATNVSAVKVKVEPIVAKVHVIPGLPTKVEPVKDETGNAKKNQVEADVVFNPVAVMLTGYKETGYTIKRLPAYSQTDADAWSNYNNVTTQRSGWVGATPGSVKYYSVNDVVNTTTHAAKSDVLYAGAYTGGQYFYPFENQDDDPVKQTSIVVLGRYDVYKKGTTTSIAAADGTFYLLAAGSSFTVYDKIKDVIEKMGGKTTKTVTEGETTTEVALTDAEMEAMLEEVLDKAGDNTSWTGWMQLKGDNNSVIKCIKYKGGYGYYSQPIIRTTYGDNDYEAIVRNTEYNLTIKTIQGMGVGVPSYDRDIIHITPPDPSQETYYMHIGVEILNWLNSTYDVEWK